MFTNLYFREEGQPNEQALFWRGSVMNRMCMIRGYEQWYSNVHSDSIRLTPGEYDVIPFITILQNAIPKALIEHIGIIPNIYDQTFLDIPVKQKMGHLTVTAAEHQGSR
jgi:hypothetical protein